MNSLGNPVIGLGERIPEYEGLPLKWMPHFQVADVGKSVESTLELGGKDLMHSKTEDGISQWAVLEDPSGSAFGIIPVVDSADFDADANKSCGRIAWLSLAVEDAVTTGKFYERVLGWTSKPSGEKFEMYIDDETSAAEIYGVGSESDLKSVWLIHVPVGDLVESIGIAKENGGEVIEELDGGAIIRDPVGVYFALKSAQ